MFFLYNIKMSNGISRHRFTRQQFSSSVGEREFRMRADTPVSSHRVFRSCLVTGFFISIAGTTCFVILLYKANAGTGVNRYINFDGVGTYKLHITGANWTEAVHTCLHEGAHLAIADSKTEADIFGTMMNWFLNSGDIAYLGFHDSEQEGKYRTVFGLPLSYSGFEKWADGYPVGTNKYNCGCIHRSGGLCDHICNVSIPFFCEKFV